MKYVPLGTYSVDQPTYEVDKYGRERHGSNTYTVSYGKRDRNRSGYDRGSSSDWKFPTKYGRYSYSAGQSKGITLFKTYTEATSLRRGFVPSVSTVSGALSRDGHSGGDYSDFNRLNRAEVEAKNKIGDQRINLSVTAGEGRKAALGIIENGHRVMTAFNAIRKGKFKDVRDALRVSGGRDPVGKDASSQWLEYQYAWTPLLMDVKNGYDEFRRKALDPNCIFSVVRNVSETGSINSHTYDGWRILGSCEKKTQVKLWFTIDDPYLYRMQQLGLANPASLAWELLPFSFVVDWFLPIGELIESTTATMGTKFHAGYNTQFIENDCYAIDVPGSAVSLQSSTVQHIRTRQYDRQPYRDFPKPVPYIKDPFSLSHGLSFLALLRTTIK